MNTSIINDINIKYNQEFSLIQSRGFNSVYSSEKYIANIFPKWYDLNNYKNNYEKLSQIHSNIPEIISWNNDWNYYIQNKIKNSIDNWVFDIWFINPSAFQFFYTIIRIYFINK